MSELIALLRQKGVSELACQFACFIERLDKTGDPLIVLSAALVSDANSQGHVCLNLAQTLDNGDFVLPESVAEWQQRLKQSHLVGAVGEFTPLILTDSNLLYLYRYYQDEQHVATAIRQRCQPIEINNVQTIQQHFADWPTDISGTDWQKVAVFMALTQQFSVIYGGPGTGKTSIVLKLLTMLFVENSEMKIALTAPTGKAAARLQQAVDMNGYDIESKTLHRLLGISQQQQQGRYSAERPLTVDIVIIDESSMIDISLMATLMRSLPKHGRLVLLGDSQQLASMGSGAVLANLCQSSMRFSVEFCESLARITDNKIAATNEKHPLTNRVVELQHNYRFDQNSDIGQLATAVKTGDIHTVLDVVMNAQVPIWQQHDDAMRILSEVITLYQEFFEAVDTNSDPLSCMQLFEQQRVLCALKKGQQSVQSINDAIEQQRHKQGFYHGKPIMVIKNDYRQQLFNGDTGLILRDGAGELKACFLFDNTLHWFDLVRLPAHETAYAITIHKSQGSEFDNVCILLAEQENPLLTKELLYTATTRAKKQVILLCSEAILKKTIGTQHQRETGLAELLKEE